MVLEKQTGTTGFNFGKSVLPYLLDDISGLTVEELTAAGYAPRGGYIPSAETARSINDDVITTIGNVAAENVEVILGVHPVFEDSDGIGVWSRALEISEGQSE